MTPLDIGTKGNIHKRLRLRLIVYFAISILLMGISIFHLIKDGASVLIATIGLIIGVGIGMIVARIFKISWDNNASQVISKFDTVGVIILIFYILFEIKRAKIVGYFVAGPSVIAVSFSLLAGIMYGRVLGIHGKINEVFKEQGII